MTTNEFLEERKHGLGASDVACVLGYSKFRTPIEVWLEKTSDGVINDSNIYTRFGNFAEEFVAREYGLERGVRTVRFNKQLRHSVFPNITGNIDRLVVPAGQRTAAHQGEIRTSLGLECKTVSDWGFRKGGEWGDEEDGVPMAYLIQCHIYLALTPCEQWDLAALVGGNKLKIYTIQKNRSLEHELCRRGQDWWDKHVVTGIPPEPSCEADVQLLYPQATPKKEAVADHVAFAAVRELRRINNEIAELEKIKEALQTDVKRGLAGAEILVDESGDKLATWGNRKGRTMFDLRGLLEAQNPGALPEEINHLFADISRRFTKTAAPSRAFILKEMKDE